MKSTLRIAAAFRLVSTVFAGCRSRRASEIEFQSGHDAPASEERGSVYRIAHIDLERRLVTLRPASDTMTVAVERGTAPELKAEILGFADLERLVGGGKSADEIVLQMQEGGDVTLYRNAVSGRLSRLSY